LKAESLGELRQALPGVAFVAADPGGGTPFTDWDWTAGAAIVLGAETDPAKRPDLPAVKIPMAGRVESLNVAVAAGIILHEAYRQRSGGKAAAKPRKPAGRKKRAK
jgi:tRNA G18 (ribose-2'-O)-methylase SpoU